MSYDVQTSAAADALAIKTSSATVYGASASSILATMAGWNWTAIITCSVAVFGLVAQIYFMARRDRRERREHEERLAALKERCEV